MDVAHRVRDGQHNGDGSKSKSKSKQSELNPLAKTEGLGDRTGVYKAD